MEGSTGKEKIENKIRQTTVKNRLGRRFGCFNGSKRTVGEEKLS